MLLRGLPLRWLAALALAGLSACDCGSLGLDQKRFACATDEDCLAGHRCRDVGDGLECVPEGAPSDGGATDGGTADGGVDQDRDGYSPPEDCDDTRREVRPGAPEVCLDFLDNDCDRGTDCADTECAGRACGTAAGSACLGLRCAETACSEGTDNDLDGLTDCADPDCAGQACGVGGTCVNLACQASSEQSLCGDGLDNDGDTLVDCRDSVDCPMGSPCSDTNACTLGDSCNATGACGPGAPLVCTTPPGTCFASPGVCTADAGVCRYTFTVGATCSDGLTCTKNDTCTSDGGCTGVPLCDAPPSVCHQPVGTCTESDGGCAYGPRPSGPCNDNDTCTLNDSCNGDGGCAGTPVVCAPPSQCHRVNGCTGDGGCLFSISTGQGCDAGAPGPGSCNAAGSCVPLTEFPFAPSNFTEAQLPTRVAGLSFNCGTTTLDTGGPNGALTWTNNCAGNPTSVSFTELVLGTHRAVLLYTDALTVAPGSQLRATGGRALIIAVRGSAGVHGVIDVGSTAGDAGAGSGAGCTAGVGLRGAARSFGGHEMAGGSGGGAFGTAGGAGGSGDGTMGGVGGVPQGTPQLVPLQGGCPGGQGGAADVSPAPGGRGGGALQLTVGGTLSVTGLITAYGAGGAGGMYDAVDTGGGGGGGSGGGLLLEANVFTMGTAGTLTANGGGGGQGAAEASGTGTAPSGANGSPVAAGPAPGGASSACGGNGGSGAAGSTAAQSGLNESCSSGGSGGGGGGGVGRIFIRAASSCTVPPTVTISPAAQGIGTAGCP
ncbi:MAG: hypothetical protein AMXMBFR34_09810 [Myxococcaceae bacterium]